MAELQAAADRAARGVRDPEAVRKALRRMNGTREEIRSRVGTLDVAVDLIRSARDP
jgi:Arc/MetJ-type ribon-helix-helix transcriptional regulator